MLIFAEMTPCHWKCQRKIVLWYLGHNSGVIWPLLRVNECIYNQNNENNSIFIKILNYKSSVNFIIPAISYRFHIYNLINLCQDICNKYNNICQKTCTAVLHWKDQHTNVLLWNLINNILFKRHISQMNRQIFLSRKK